MAVYIDPKTGVEFLNKEEYDHYKEIKANLEIYKEYIKKLDELRKDNDEHEKDMKLHPEKYKAHIILNKEQVAQMIKQEKQLKDELKAVKAENAKLEKTIDNLLMSRK